MDHSYDWRGNSVSTTELFWRKERKYDLGEKLLKVTCSIYDGPIQM